MDNLAYGKKRLARFFPYTTVAFVIALITKRIIPNLISGKGTTFLQLYKWLSKDIWELTLLSMNGLNGEAGLLNGVVWTLSAMLICEVVIWGLLEHNEQLFRTIIAPFSILSIFGFWKNLDSADHKLWRGFTTFGVLRVFLIMCIGYFVFEVATKLSEVHFSKRTRICLTGCEILCLLISFVNMELFSTRYFRFENIVLFCVVVCIAYSGQSFSEKICGFGGIAKYLGELSLGVYLVHDSVLHIFKILYPDPYVMYSHKFEYFFVVLLASALFLIIVKRLITLFERMKRKIVGKANV